MSSPTPLPEDRHSAVLAELAAMSLTLARDLQNRALEAESVADATRLAAAFQQVSRGLRQTLALELKVIRYRDELAREAAAADEECAAVERMLAENHAEAVRRRGEQIRSRVSHAIWFEEEDLSSDELPEGFEPPEDPEALAEALDRWVEAAMRRGDFLRTDYVDLVFEACEAIGADVRVLYETREPTRAAPAARPPPGPADSS
ncbi:hypothetical protein [Phenylobacterium sp.]|uniref:hypothetical protein n=1 Tax=Phenylobacterium sp. TaxID=1871053 RepID=UPI0035AD7FFE